MEGLEFRSWWGAFSFREWDPAQTLQVGSYQAGRLGAFPVLKQTLEMPGSPHAGQANGLKAARNRQKSFSGGPHFRYEWLLLSLGNLRVPEHPASCKVVSLVRLENAGFVMSVAESPPPLGFQLPLLPSSKPRSMKEGSEASLSLQSEELSVPNASSDYFLRIVQALFLAKSELEAWNLTAHPAAQFSN